MKASYEDCRTLTLPPGPAVSRVLGERHLA